MKPETPPQVITYKLLGGTSPERLSEIVTDFIAEQRQAAEALTTEEFRADVEWQFVGAPVTSVTTLGWYQAIEVILYYRRRCFKKRTVRISNPKAAMAASL